MKTILLLIVALASTSIRADENNCEVTAEDIGFEDAHTEDGTGVNEGDKLEPGQIVSIGDCKICLCTTSGALSCYPNKTITADEKECIVYSCSEGYERNPSFLRESAQCGEGETQADRPYPQCYECIKPGLHPCTQKMDLAFVVDASTSICGPTKCKNWNFNLDFIRNVISDMNIGPDQTRVAIITFADNAVLAFYLDEHEDKDSLLKAVENVEYTGGETNTTGAFQLLLSDIFVPEHGDRPEVPNTAIIITDGVPNRDSKFLKATVTDAHQKIKCLAIGVTNNVKDSTLQLIASPPGVEGEDYFKAQAYETMDNVRVELATHACQARN